MPTNDFPMVDVQSIRPLEGCRLWVRFTDGSEGVRDLSDVIAKVGVMVEALKSKDYFERVLPDMGAPTWPNGFDIAPDWLWREMEAAGELPRGGGVNPVQVPVTLRCAPRARLEGPTYVSGLLEVYVHGTFSS